MAMPADWPALKSVVDGTGAGGALTGVVGGEGNVDGGAGGGVGGAVVGGASWA